MRDRVYLHRVQKALGLVTASSKSSFSGRLELKSMPLPPSSNGAYRNVPGKGRVLTREALLWKYEMNAWAMDNLESVANLAIMGSEKRPMACECVFFFPTSDVYSLAGEPKALDPPNFQKLLIDHLCLYAGFDDRWFFRTEAEKAYGAASRYVDMSIRFVEPRIVPDELELKLSSKSPKNRNSQATNRKKNSKDVTLGR